MSRTKNIGLDVKAPSNICKDKKCPFHSNVQLRGKIFTGTIVSDKMQGSVVVEWTGWRFVPKYERYKKTKTKVSAHNPKCIGAKEGDVVKISECRPLSKTKNFVVVEIQGSDKEYALKKEADNEGKHKITDKEQANKDKAKVAEVNKQKSEK